MRLVDVERHKRGINWLPINGGDLNGSASERSSSCLIFSPSMVLPPCVIRSPPTGGYRGVSVNKFQRQ